MQTAGRTHRRRAERKPQGWTDLLAGVPQGTPAPNPPYLTGGYKSTGNSLKIKRNPAGYMGFLKIRRVSAKYRKLTYAFLIGGIFTES
ncbi:hypothetical protein SMUE_12970 [Enterococcus cecorum]